MCSMLTYSQFPEIGVYFCLFFFSHRHNTSHLQYKREHDNFFRLKLTSRFHLSTRVIALCCLCVPNFESQLLPSAVHAWYHSSTVRRAQRKKFEIWVQICEYGNFSHESTWDHGIMSYVENSSSNNYTPAPSPSTPQHINNASHIIDTLIMVWMLSRLPSCCLFGCVVAVYYSWECVIKRKREINNVSDNEIRDVLSSCKRRTYIYRESLRRLI